MRTTNLTKDKTTYYREYKQKNLEKLTKYAQEYREKNRLALAQYARDYRKRKKGHVLETIAKINTQRLIENRGEYLRRKAS
jgi:hypothetical protein